MVQNQTERPTVTAVRVSSWVTAEATAAACHENTPPQLLAGSNASYWGGGGAEVLTLKIDRVCVSAS